MRDREDSDDDPRVRCQFDHGRELREIVEELEVPPRVVRRREEQRDAAFSTAIASRT